MVTSISFHCCRLHHPDAGGFFYVVLRNLVKQPRAARKVVLRNLFKRLQAAMKVVLRNLFKQSQAAEKAVLRNLF